MIVFDSSTLILLAKADILDSFVEDFRGKVLIPREVEDESCDRKESFDALQIRRKIREKKIGVVKISNVSLCAQLMRDFRISRGESEALALALVRNAKLIATDDKNAIKACKLLKISYTSAMALLVRMAEKKVIEPDKAKTALGALMRYGSYSIGIIKEAKTKLNVK